MPRFQLAYKASTKQAKIQKYGDDTIAGYSTIGNYYHGGGGTDVLDSHSANHTHYHHVQDLVYRVAGEQNMQAVEITMKRVTAIDAAAVDVALNLTDDTTEQINTTFTPTDAANRDLTYSSSNVAVATVDAAGLVTSVGVGTAIITVTSADDPRVTDTVTVTVS